MKIVDPDQTARDADHLDLTILALRLRRLAPVLIADQVGVNPLLVSTVLRQVKAADLAESGEDRRMVLGFYP